MGDYGYDEHVELFGGPPDRDECARDVLDEVDQLRKEAKENPHPGSTRQPCPFYVIVSDGTRSYCRLGKDHNVPHEPGRTYEEYLAALKGPVVVNDTPDGSSTFVSQWEDPPR